MHTVELLEHAIGAAKRLGYTIRQDCLAGRGGSCELKGRKLFFLDLDLGADEQLEQILEVLRAEPEIGKLEMPKELRQVIGISEIA
ncbi:MAG: hypothetical protein LLG00_14430 [Planctomycetaceae bacterium]|nr:hypothetical protein [Planctomycetaceae bacterium]